MRLEGSWNLCRGTGACQRRNSVHGTCIPASASGQSSPSTQTGAAVSAGLCTASYMVPEDPWLLHMWLYLGLLEQRTRLFDSPCIIYTSKTCQSRPWQFYSSRHLLTPAVDFCTLQWRILFQYIMHQPELPADEVPLSYWRPPSGTTAHKKSLHFLFLMLEM